MQSPASITYHKIAHTLEVTWPDATFTLPAELLRVYSPSAEVRGHSDSERKLQTGKKHVGIRRVEPVGNYAIRIVFDDGHDSGIFAWDYLHQMGKNQDRLWQEYFAELKSANASRLPKVPVGQWRPPGK